MKPDIIAHLTLYPTDKGGRKGKTPSDQFGCLLELDGEYFDCRLILDGVVALSPGQTATVPIKFLSPELLKGHLGVLQDVHLWDGHRIADGKVLESFLS